MSKTIDGQTLELAAKTLQGLPRVLTAQQAQQIISDPEIAKRFQELLGWIPEVIFDRTHEVAPVKHVIDLGADPFIPDGWSVVEHTRMGLFDWDQSKVALHLEENQRVRLVCGKDLRSLLANKPVFSANLLDWLLDHSELIPEDWRGQSVVFWGTIYCLSGCLYVRCLDWRGVRWCWTSHWLGGSFGGRDPALIRVRA